MKLTMVLADDEPVVLKSEELFIKIEFPDIEILGMAENGIVLKQMLEQYQPDMAMIDIRMPGLSGIEVIELLHHNNGRTHFILNTAYSDFEYIKKALDLKTDGYLLKPSKREEKLELIRRMCHAVEEEKKEDQRQNSIQSALDIVNSVLGSEILLSVFSDENDEEGFLAYCNLNNIEFHYGCIATFLPKEKKDLDIKKLNEELEKGLHGLCQFLSTITAQGLVVMFFIPREIEQMERKKWCEELTILLAGHLKKSMGMEYIYGTGKVYPSYSDMRYSYHDSIEALQVSGQNTDRLTEETADKMEAYISRTKKYIEECFRRDISLLDCARSVGISPYYLSHIFKEQTGQNFVEYLTGVRIEEAKRLCRTTNLNIEEISAQCGYLNITYFCRVFKRITGMTIGEYRREERKEG